MENLSKEELIQMNKELLKVLGKLLKEARQNSFAANLSVDDTPIEKEAQRLLTLYKD